MAEIACIKGYSISAFFNLTKALINTFAAAPFLSDAEEFLRRLFLHHGLVCAEKSIKFLKF